jgi:hypothetical protein
MVKQPAVDPDAILHILQAVAHFLKIYVNIFVPLRQSLLNFSLFSDFFLQKFESISLFFLSHVQFRFILLCLLLFGTKTTIIY